MTPKNFVDRLSQVRLAATFNPYGDRCPVDDRKDAARIRRTNLQTHLEAAIDCHVDTVWIARDLGYRGGRRTGLPLTDEPHLPDAGELLGGVRFGRATKGPEVAETTARVVWSALRGVSAPAVLWNVFPFHPHEPGNPFSNRCHSKAERAATSEFLRALLFLIKPTRLVAIGRDAEHALAEFDLPVYPVRHPSHGGQRKFTAGITEVYGPCIRSREKGQADGTLFEKGVSSQAVNGRR